MLNNDPIAKFRDNPASSYKWAMPSLPLFEVETPLGKVERFKGKVQVRVSVVRLNGQVYLLLATYGATDSGLELKSWILLEFTQIPDLLEGIDQARQFIQNLRNLPHEDWPSLTESIAKCPGSGGTTLFVHVEEYREYLDIMTSTKVDRTSSRTGQFCKFSAFEVANLIPLIVQAYDAIAEPATPSDTSEEDIDF